MDCRSLPVLSLNAVEALKHSDIHAIKATLHGIVKRICAVTDTLLNTSDTILNIIKGEFLINI